MSISGSRYSQKSVVTGQGEQSSPSYDENTHTSVSYRGSEISVFISPTPIITVGHKSRDVSLLMDSGSHGSSDWRQLAFKFTDKSGSQTRSGRQFLRP